MDQGWCGTAIAVRAREGNSDGIDLGGRTVVMAADFPGPTLFDGNATARLYIDADASPEQRRELEAIMTGAKGGPLGALAPLMSTWLPSRSAQIDIDETGDVIEITIDGSLGFESRRLRDTQGSDFTLRGGGFISAMGMEEVALAPTGGSWTDPDLRKFDVKSGARGDFVWSA
jgi:hypothetical protein